MSVFCHDCDWRENPDQMRRLYEQGFLPTFGLGFGGFGTPMYDQHRESWVKTGDEDELRRMTNHVTWSPS